MLVQAPAPTTRRSRTLPCSENTNAHGATSVTPSTKASGAPNRLAEDARRAGLRHQQPDQDSDQSGLAGTIAPDETQDGALGYREAHIAENLAGSELLANVLTDHRKLHRLL
jgi:hypothetical protein